MSSNYTAVCQEEWEDTKKEIAKNEAFVISKEGEIAELEAEALHRQKKREAYAKDAKEELDKITVSVVDTFEEKAKVLLAGKGAMLAKAKSVFEAGLQDIRSKAQDTGVKTADLNNKINAVAAEYSGILDGYTKTLTDLSDRVTFEVKELNNLMTQIHGLHPGRFAVAEYNTLVGKLDAINQNISAKNYQAVLMQAQHSVEEASSLLVKLLAMNETYNARYTEVKKKLDDLTGRTDAFAAEGASLHVLGTNYTYDINYWSFGQFAKLRTEVEELNKTLTASQLNLDGLSQISKHIDILSNNLSVIDSNARFERGCAIVIESKKNSLIQEMKDHGWKLLSGKYENDDNRNPYTAVFTDGSGNTISVLINSEDSVNVQTTSEVFTEDMDDTDKIDRIKDATNHIICGRDATLVDAYTNDDCEENTDSDTFLSNTMYDAMETLTERRKVFNY